ncbi:TPA_asm: oncoid1 [African termite bidnaparvovirus]|nr:TPA_asm: oncoid1 [African termite bidnaparvovirus]
MSINVVDYNNRVYFFNGFTLINIVKRNAWYCWICRSRSDENIIEFGKRVEWKLRKCDTCAQKCCRLFNNTICGAPVVKGEGLCESCMP